MCRGTLQSSDAHAVAIRYLAGLYLEYNPAIEPHADRLACWLSGPSLKGSRGIPTFSPRSSSTLAPQPEQAQALVGTPETALTEQTSPQEWPRPCDYFLAPVGDGLLFPVLSCASGDSLLRSLNGLSLRIFLRSLKSRRATSVV